MKVAIYGLTITPDFFSDLAKLISILKEKKIDIYIFEPFLRHLQENCHFIPSVAGIFHSGDDLPEDVKFLMSIGGDGTFLKSVFSIKNKSIPVIGINSGRLGFLSDIAREETENALEAILSGEYVIEERSVLQIESTSQLFGDFNYALNEITVTKLETASMINIHTYLNDEYLNTYWADGLIIATPTGSTAYSLSVGGPILTPDSANFVISPIAPHNLTVRPLVVPDYNTISLVVEGRGQHFMASVDSRSQTFLLNEKLTIRKADFNVKTLRLNSHSFFKTLRNKLMWGADKRN